MVNLEGTSIEIPSSELIQVNLLKTDKDNPNRMTPQQLERLKSSIEKYGFIVPIITNKDLVIADGEQRWIVAKTLNMTHVPIIRLPLEDVDRRLVRQVLNKLRGEHDLILDAHEFDRIIQMGHEDELKHFLDLNDSQLERYLQEIHEPNAETYEIPEIDKITTSIQRGDIYALGKHRLMCGDATNKSDVEALMNGEKADLLLTDPPYGIGVVNDEGTVGKANVAKLTKYGDFEGDKIFDIKPILNLDCYKHAVIWGGNYFADKLPITNSWLIWDKRAGEASWFSDFELAWSNLGTGPKLFQFVWQGMIRQGPRIKRVHPTQKPAQLMSWCLTLTNPSQTILDLFGGSGSTLIACEQTNRICYMMEIDPRYCQVIINRWEAYTRLKAIKADKK